MLKSRYESLVKKTLREIKEIASDMSIFTKDAKAYGNSRQKTSWIDAILSKQKEIKDAYDAINGDEPTITPKNSSKPIITAPVNGHKTATEDTDVNVLDVKSSIVIIDEPEQTEAPPESSDKNDDDFDNAW